MVFHFIFLATGCTLSNIFYTPFMERLSAYVNKLQLADGSCSDLIVYLNLYRVSILNFLSHDIVSLIINVIIHLDTSVTLWLLNFVITHLKLLYSSSNSTLYSEISDISILVFHLTLNFKLYMINISVPHNT